MAKYRKKSVIVDAYTFDELVKMYKENKKDIFEINGQKIPAIHHYDGNNISSNPTLFFIETSEGVMSLTKEYVLIIETKDECYPCKIDIFEETYEKV